jgi:Condensation domain
MGGRALSALQRRMWHLCTSYPGTSSPIVVLAWRIHGALDVGRFTQAVEAVVNRHDSLRGVFVVEEGEPALLVRPPGRFETELRDDVDALAVVRERGAALLSLERGPLTASCLIRVSNVEHIWCFTVHHLLADGASAMIVEQEVAALYRGEPLPAATNPDPETDGDLDWWVTTLKGAPVLELPADLPRPPVKTTSTAGLDFVVDLALTERLERLARAQRCTVFMVLFTGYQVMLQKVSGQNDFCVGIPVDGRTSVESERAVGLFANMLALRADLAEPRSFTDLLRRTRAVTIEALSRQNVPFGQIVTALDPPVDPSRTQVFQTIFTLHTEAGPGIDLPGLRIEPFGAGTPQALHDLVLDLWRNEAGIAAAFRYDTCLFKPDTVAAWARRYEEVLRAAAGDPEAVP